MGALVHRPDLLEDDVARDELTSTARLALEHDRLQAAARSQLADLRASRARIIATRDSERRKLERDLHDGAQQRLVSLTLSLRLAQRHAGDPAAIEWAVEEMRTAVAELRDSAHGIYPAVLGDEGLAAALETLAEADPRLRIRRAPERRFPEPVESAAYVTVLQVLRASAGDRVVVDAAVDDGALSVAVSAAGASALDRQELEDRAGALDGEFRAGRDAYVARLPLR